MTKKEIRYALFCLSGLVLVLYINTLKNDYALDDEFVTGPRNTQTQSIRNIPEILTDWYYNEMGKRSEYRPVVKISFAIENSIFGLKPGIHHFFNILLYIITCFLLLQLIITLLPGQFHFSLLAVLLFAAHPTHTEVVASLKNRDILLACIFAFWGGIKLIQQSTHEKKSLLQWFIIFVLFYLSVLSKRDALIFIFIFPFFIFFSEKKINIKNSIVSALIIFSAYAALLITIKLILPQENQNRTLDFFENPIYQNKDLLSRAIAGVNTSGFYFLQNFFPFRLISYYGFNQIPVSSWNSLYFFAGVIGWIFSFIGLFLFARLRSGSKTGIIFLLGGMILYLNFVRPVPGIVGDRFVFVSSVGSCLLMSTMAFHFFSTQKIPVAEWNHLTRLGKIVLSSVFILFALITIRRNAEWKNKEVLFSHDILKAENSTKLHSLYANELISQIRNGEEGETNLTPKEKAEIAEQALRKSISIYPDYTNSLNNLAYLLIYTKDNLPEAKGLLEKSNRIDSTNTEARYNYANVLFLLNDYKSTDSALCKVLELSDSLPEAYRLLSQNAAKTGNFLKTAQRISEHLPKQLKNDEMFTLLGNLYARGGDTLQAVAYYDSALTLRPVNTNMGKFLFRYYQSKGDTSKAERIKKLFRKTNPAYTGN